MSLGDFVTCPDGRLTGFVDGIDGVVKVEVD